MRARLELTKLTNLAQRLGMRARLELPLPFELNTAHGGRGGGPCGNVKLARQGGRRRAGCT